MQAAPGAPVASGPTTDTQPSPHRPSPHRRRLVWLVTTAVVVLVVDVVSKHLVVARLSDRAPVHVVDRVLELTVVRNSGAAFGIGAGATIVFTAVAVGVVVVIVRRARQLSSAGWALSLGLLLGGALGNLCDRLFRSPGLLRGHVVDWIELPHWPVFNLADAAIVTGGLLCVALSMRGAESDDAGRDDADSDDAAPEHADEPRESRS